MQGPVRWEHAAESVRGHPPRADRRSKPRPGARLAVIFGLIPFVVFVEGMAVWIGLYSINGRSWIETTIPWVLDLARVPYLMSVATFGLLALLCAAEARRARDLPPPARSTGVAGIILGILHMLNVGWAQIALILLPFTG